MQNRNENECRPRERLRTSEKKWTGVDSLQTREMFRSLEFISCLCFFYVGNGLLDKSLLAREFLPFRLLESFGNNSASMLQVSIFCSATRRNPMIVM